MGYENMLIRVDRRRTRPHDPSADSVAFTAVKVGGDGGTEVTSLNVVTTDNTAAFLNKTFDAEGTGNSLSNISNSNIKELAGILESKLSLDYSTDSLNTAVLARLPLAGGTMTGAINMDTFKITTTYVPVDGADLVNKTYADALTAPDATAGSGGATKGILTVDSDKGLELLTGEVLGVKVDDLTIGFSSTNLAVKSAGIDEQHLNSAIDAQTFASTHIGVNYTPVAVGSETATNDGTAKISAHLKGIDLAIGLLSSGIVWKPKAKVITADGDLNAAADDTALSTLLPFSDDDGTQMVIGDFSAGDYLLSSGGTNKRFLVWDDAGTLKVTTSGVEQPISGYTYVVSNDLIDSDGRENVSIYHVSGTIFVKIGDVDFSVATGIDLSGGYAVAGSTTVVPASGDSVETAISKLHAGALNDQAITARVLHADIAGNGIAGGNGTALSADVDGVTLTATGGTGAQIAVLADGINETHIRLQNNAFLTARNAGNDGDVNMFKVNASDQVEMATHFYTPASAPTADYQVANKKYVDDTDLALKLRSYTAASWTNGTGSQAVKGDIGYLDTDNTVKPAESGTTDIAKKRIVVCYDATIDNASAGNWIALPSVSVGDDSGMVTVTVGEEVYLSSTLGVATQNINSITAGEPVILLGYGAASNDWEFIRPEYIGDA